MQLRQTILNKSLMDLVAKIMIIGIIVISGCALPRQVSQKDLILWIESGNDINPNMETLCVRYNRISKDEILTMGGHTIMWEAPGGLSGYYRFNDPTDGGVYGNGNWKEDWEKAEADGVVDMAKELPMIYYRIGEVQRVGGKLRLNFPKGTRLIFEPPEPFSGANYYVIIKLPEIPRKANLDF